MSSAPGSRRDPRPRVGGRSRLWATAAVLVLAAACSSSDGTTLQQPDTPAATQPVRPTAANLDDLVVPTGDFRIASPDFVDGDLLPARFTFESGAGTSPRFKWGEVPAEAQELALVLVDVNRDVIHWVVSGLDPTRDRLEENDVPPGAVQALNDFGMLGYAPPALQEDGQHRFVFTLYALFEPIGLQEGLFPRDAIRLIEESTMASTEIAVIYG